MRNNRTILNEIEFETQIKAMNDRTLMEFTARQVYAVVLLTSSQATKIKALEHDDRQDKRRLGVVGGVGGVIGTAIGAAFLTIYERLTKG